MEELQVPSVTPVPLPPTPPVKNSLLVIMSFLLLIAVGLAGFFYWQMQRLSKELAKYQSATPTPSATPIATTKVDCQDPRPEVCTLECIQNPPYICGSDGKSYCTVCQACANKDIAWYEIKITPCGEGN